MENKGQALVIFVLILPILFLLFALIWEVGNLGITTNKYETEIKDTIKYGLNNLDKEKLEENLKTLLSKNIKGNINVNIKEEVITINVKEDYHGLYSNLFKEKYKIDITYIGYKENNKIIIKRGDNNGN